VEAVPRFAPDGTPTSQEERKLMNTTMQTLGRVALIGGLVLVAGINLYLFSDVESLSITDKAAVYRQVYLMALVIPFVSVAGVALAFFLQRRDVRRLIATGMDRAAARAAVYRFEAPPPPNWWILGGSLAFVLFTVAMGLSDLEWSQEIIFIGSMAI